MREIAARGRTVLFATHYLEEADAYADRVVLMAAGRIVADGPPTEIKAMVGTRTIRATLPGADLGALERAAGRQLGRAARQLVRAALRRLRQRDPRAARGLPRRRATSRSAAPGSRRRSSSSPPTTTPRRSHDELARLHPLRAAARLPRPALLHLLARLPARPVLPVRGARTATSTTSTARGSRRRSTTWSGSRPSGRWPRCSRSGARIAGERSVGWNRQLRLTPLSVRSYFRAKVVTAYVMALSSIVLMDVAGTSLGVRLSADRWISMTVLMLDRADPVRRRSASSAGTC